ncbi:MAG: histidinol dehydrogenase, partial [Thermoplasmatota archaeon]
MVRWAGPVDALSRGELAALVARGGTADAMDTFVDAVRPIRVAVRPRGDPALVEFTERFDKFVLREIEVPRAARKDALAALAPSARKALDAAKTGIAAFHERQLRRPESHELSPGVTAGRRFLPFDRVGVYVPGGRAAYPSTVLMTVVPAKLAGVREVVLCSPPPIAPLTLAAAELAGADRVFQIGGAQAIFAMAYGTQSVPKVDKIVGPGNAYVAAAKALVAGEVAIDAPAGPSEVLVVADASADADLVARELVAQAEHDPRAACVAVATDAALAQRIEDATANLLARLRLASPRSAIVREALAARGAILVAHSLAEALAFADRYAPEHLALYVRDPDAALLQVSNYGSAFLGEASAVAFGDYGVGPNHVLPTGGL